MVTGAVYAAVPALIWSSFVYLVQSIGLVMLFRHYSSPPRKPVSPSLPPHLLPHITIIRPVKGLEPDLHACLSSTFHQTYPAAKLSIRLCVASEADPAYPILEQIVAAFSATHDVSLLVEEYDPVLSSLDGDTLGPNPKIRNISRAYREARADDVIWIVDCNVWISRGVAGRMVDRLMGFLPGGKRTTPFRFVHHLPLVVNGPAEQTTPNEATSLLPTGGQLDEMFFTTTHAKFYTAINTIGVAPCIIGKSNMFRKSHLDTFTAPAHAHLHLSPSPTPNRGLDFFSSNICEDHLIGDLLWRAAPLNATFRKHGLVWGDVALQPLTSPPTVPIAAYWARRVRWLRARKWTVLLATLVEPGVESLPCNLLFAYAATTLPWFQRVVGIPPTWPAFAAGWALGEAIWCACDRAVYTRLHALRTVEVDADTPAFARGRRAAAPFLPWLGAWVGREVLAFPIWLTAVMLGSTISWRGKTFRVRRDMSVVALDDTVEKSPAGNKKDACQGDEVEVVSGWEDKHPEMQPTPKWEGRPTARQRKSRSRLDD